MGDAPCRSASLLTLGIEQLALIPATIIFAGMNTNTGNTQDVSRKPSPKLFSLAAIFER
jgi:hypothetical protein